jgi:glycosyltransferase involved in cell wall biosynthesis
MRILFLDQFSELGGGQHALLDTVDAVRQIGWEPGAMIPGHGPLVAALQSRGVHVEEIPCGPHRAGRKTAADSVRFALDLRRQVRRIGNLVASTHIDLIYVNGPRLLPAVALAERGQTPVVFHVHSHLHGGALHLARWAIRRADATLIGCSKSVLTPLQRKQHVIPNGVRDAGYRERDFDRQRNWRIGMVGRIAPEKGQMEFVSAVAMLKGKFPQARFVICGAPQFDASSHYIDSVGLRARGLPVEFIGWQPDVSHVLHDLDLLAVPSHQEGMGRIVLEAFSAGVPIVAFPVGGIPEAVIDGVTGFLTIGPSAEALAARISDVLTRDADDVRQIVRNARQAWARSYTEGAYQKRITNLLQALVSDFHLASPPAHATETPLQSR